jgi:hypothetical protein
MNDNFYIVTDMDGKMPMVCRRTPTHPGMPKMAWVKYVADRPVEIKPYNGQGEVYDYYLQEFLALHVDTKTWDGRDMPLFKGKVIK